MRLNKKGHIGTLLMVIGALILIIATLFSFVSFKNEVRDSRKEIRKLAFLAKYDVNGLLEIFKYTLINSINESKKESDFIEKFKLKLIENAKIERDSNDNNNLFGKLANGEFVINEIGSEYLLKIEGVHIKDEVEKNEIIYKFDLVARFDVNKLIGIERLITGKVYK